LAPAECAIAVVPSTPVPRVIVRVPLEGVLGEITSTISSRAVSGSITTVKVSPDPGLILERRADAEATTIVLAPDVNAETSVVSCEVEEYFLIGMY
jgi:hypothetical protein